MLEGALALNGLGAGEGRAVVGRTGGGGGLLFGSVTGLNLEGTVPALARRKTGDSNSGWSAMGSGKADCCESCEMVSRSRKDDDVVVEDIGPHICEWATPSSA